MTIRKSFYSGLVGMKEREDHSSLDKLDFGGKQEEVLGEKQVISQSIALIH